MKSEYLLKGRIVTIVICFLLSSAYQNAGAQVLDDDFVSPGFYWSSAASILHVAEDGSIFMEGSHEFVGDQAIKGLIKVDSEGNLDPDFNHGTVTGSTSGKIDLLSDGKIVVASNAHPSTLYLLSADGSSKRILYESDLVDFEVLPNDLLLLRDVGTLSAIVIDTLGVQQENYAFNDDGGINDTGGIYDFTINDRYIYLLGNFQEMNGHPTANIARFNLDGTIDTSYSSEAAWYFGTSNYYDYYIEYQDTIYRSYGQDLQKVLPSGALDTSVPDNVLGNSFNNLEGMLYADSLGIMVRDWNVIKRMNFDGTVDPSFLFQYSKDFNINLVRLPSGAYWLTGHFGTPDHYGVRKVSESGEAIAFDFKLYKDNPILYTLETIQGSLFVGGHFTSIDGLQHPANSLVKLSANGEYDPSFVIPSGLSDYYYVDYIVEDYEGRIATLGSQKLNIFDDFGQIHQVPLNPDLGIVNKAIPHPDGLICITNTVLLLDWDNEIDPSFDIPFADDITDIYTLKDGSLLAMYSYTPEGSSSSLNQVIRIKTDLTLDDDYPTVLDGTYRDLYQVNDTVFFAVGDDLVKFSSEGLIDTTFVNNYTGPTAKDFELVDIDQIYDEFLFLSRRSERIHVTDADGRYLDSKSMDLSRELNYRSIRAVEVDKDDIYLIVGRYNDHHLAKIYVNSVPEIMGATYPIAIPEDTTLFFDISHFEVKDLNHTAEELTAIVLEGEHYSIANDSIILERDYSGPLTIGIKIEDPSQASDTVFMSIEVEPVNDAPVLLEYTGETVFKINETNAFDPTDFVVEDVDTDAALLELEIQPGENYTSDNLSFTPSEGFAGELELNVAFSDGQDLGEIQMLSLIINAPPVISALDFPSTIKEDTVLVISDSHFQVADLNDKFEELAISIVSDAHFSVSGDSLILNRDYFGEIELELLVEDPYGETDSQIQVIQVSPVNDPPVLLAYTGATVFKINETNIFDQSDFDVEDVDSEPASLQLVIQPGDNYTSDDLSFTPSEGFAGELVLNVAFEDGEDLSEMQALSFIINAPPVITNLDFPSSIKEDTVLVISNSYYQLEDLNDEIDELVLTVIPGERFSMKGDSLILEKDYFGEIELELSVEDPYGETGSQSQTIQITPINDVPVFVQYNGASSFKSTDTISFAIEDFTIVDPDNTIDEIELILQEDENYVIRDSSLHFVDDFNQDQASVSLSFFDGEAYSDLVTLEFAIEIVLALEENEIAFALWPNPTHRKLKYSLVDSFSGPFTIRVRAIDGRELMQHKSSTSSGVISGELDVSSLDYGVYFFEIDQGNSVKYERFIVSPE